MNEIIFQSSYIFRSEIASHRNMPLLLIYPHQPEFLERILGKMAAEDTITPLTILTSDGRVTLSGKVLQLHSPLIRDMMARSE